MDGNNNTVTISTATSRLILDQPHKRRGVGKPRDERQLLLTEWRATTLVGRAPELAALAAWRASAPMIGIRCLTGRAGSGKTRLAIEACEAADSEGWVSGFVSADEIRRFHDSQNLAEWRSPADTLIVVDDAAGSVSILRSWFDALARRIERPDDRKLRILLLARQADPSSDFGWWADLRRADNMAQRGAFDLIGSERPLPLSSIASAADRRALLKEAMQHASAILGKQAVLVPPPGADPVFDTQIEADWLENEPLFLVMAGIYSVLTGTKPLKLGRTEFAERIAEVEAQRIRIFGLQKGLTPADAMLPHFASCVTLQRGCAASDLSLLVKDELSGLDQPNHAATPFYTTLIAEALPWRSSGAIEGVRPDLIGEIFLLKQIIGSPFRSDEERFAIVERCFARAGLPVIEVLVQAAQNFAGDDQQHYAVVWLRRLVEKMHDLAQLRMISQAIPAQTLALRDVATEVDSRISQLTLSGVRSIVVEGDGNRVSIVHEDRGREHAQALLNESARHRNVGNLESAMQAADQARRILADIEASDPLGIAPELVGALRSVATLSLELGLLETGLEAAGDAVLHSERLAASHPEAYSPLLAESLDDLVLCLARLGRPEEARPRAEEMVRLYRRLAELQPEAYRPSLAGALARWAELLRQVGRSDQALAAAREAIGLYRELAARSPEAFSSRLASSLISLGALMRELGRPDDAVQVAQEALVLHRSLAASRPDAFTPDLAVSLNNVSGFLAAVGHHEEALAAAHEAVELRRNLAAARPEAFSADLARSLANLGDQLARLGRPKEALATIEEAVELLRDLAAQRPRAFNSELLGAISGLSMARHRAGHDSAAMAAAEEAVELATTLARQRPETDAPDLAIALSMLADMCDAAGDLQRALAMDRRAIETLAPHFMERPEALGRLMSAVCRDYIQRSQKAEIEIDRMLLKPIVAELEKLQERMNDAG